MNNHNLIRDLREFLVLWGSQAVSTLGTAMTNYALIIWVYGQSGTVSSLTLLSVCSFLPSILFCFVAGAIADRWDKKRVMLATDLLAGLGTAAVLALFTAGSLQVWHLYVVNFLLSFLGAFQYPASYVATSLLVPKEHYVRVSGLQAFSGSVVTILAPAFGGALLAFGGLRLVLLLDLVSCAAACLVLLLFVRIPPMQAPPAGERESFAQSCMAGVRFLRGHAALLRIILFFAFINLIAKMGSYGMMPALVLARTGNDAVALGMVQAAVGVGALMGSVLVTAMRPAKSRVAVVFAACGLSFLLGDVMQGLTRALPLWMAAAFASNIPLAFLNANLTAIMRTNIPIEMQGRVFSARDTIQFSTIPVGLFLGGILADSVFEPLMAAASPLRDALGVFFGFGQGAGIALMFFLVGVAGAIASLCCLRDPRFRALDEQRPG